MEMADILNRPLNRRSFISGGLAVAGTVAGAGGLLSVLDACSTSSGSQSSTTTGARKRGGTLTNLASINPNALTKMDNLTVRAALNFPDAILAVRFYQPQIVLIPVGFDPQSPVGTGPFKLKTFTPGQRSDFVRNPDYWFS